MDRLQDDHVAVDRLWRPLDEQLAEVQRGGRARPDRQAIDRLIGQYLAHREAEEEALLAIVQSVLQPDDLAELGEAMAARRGLTWKQLNAGAL
jgi:pyridoxamine 5'-phosphate oxidase